MNNDTFDKKIDSPTFCNSRMTFLYFFFPHLQMDNKSFWKEMVSIGSYYSVKYEEHFNPTSLFSLNKLKNIEIYRVLPLLEKSYLNSYEKFELTYPEGNRPRGERDIDMLFELYHTKRKISPIVFLRNSSNLTLLDGQHRFFFSVLMRCELRCLIIDLSKISSIAFFSRAAWSLFENSMKRDIAKTPSDKLLLLSNQTFVTGQKLSDKAEKVAITNNHVVKLKSFTR